MEPKPKGEMQITFFAAMEETLKKALRTGIETLVSVTEEVRHGLTVLDRDIQALNRRISESRTAETTNQQVDMVTPLCTQLTYGGLLDELFGIK